MDSKHYKAIDRYYTTAKYYIGINFGCEYTSVSLFPGKNGELISHMFRIPTGFYCNGDDYTLANSDCVIGEFQMCRYHTGLPSKLTYKIPKQDVIAECRDEKIVSALDFYPNTLAEDKNLL